MTLSSQMTDESRARKNSWKWGQVKLGKALTKVFQEGWKLEDVVMWPFPQEKATAETGEGSQGDVRRWWLRRGRWSPTPGTSSPSLGRELMRGVYFIYCSVPSLL